jgi:hypothetical protein
MPCDESESKYQSVEYMDTCIEVVRHLTEKFRQSAKADAFTYRVVLLVTL